MLENIKELVQQSKINYKNLYPDWDNSASNCGPNKYIAGDVGPDFDAWDNLVVYYNREADTYYLDQPNYAHAHTLDDMILQVGELYRNLKKYKKDQA